MQVTLNVVGGKHAGKIVPVTAPRFFIGRAPDCHVRSTSSSISRHHCVILVGLCVIDVQDLGSKNGTWVNGEQVRGHRFLQSGDRLAVGRLEFEVQVTATQGGDPTLEPEEQPGNKSPHEVSEQEKEARRRHDLIVGVSKAAQARRITATSQDAAVDAIRKYLRCG